jgi:hypothetical protein
MSGIANSPGGRLMPGSRPGFRPTMIDASRARSEPPTRLSRHAYHPVPLDSMVHEFNVIRGVLGEPDEPTFANIRENGLTLALRYGPAECLIAWVDLPGSPAAHMEFAFYAPDRRLTLPFLANFLRNAPTLFIDETGDPATAKASRSEEVVSYLEGFKEGSSTSTIA